MAGDFWGKYRDPRWQQKRLRIMERAGFTCEMCGAADKTLNVHHGFYRSKCDPWEYPDDTLWCLCEDCHDTAEERKHDCQIELARINPAFLNAVFSLILMFRDGMHVLDDDGIANKLELTENYGFHEAILAMMPTPEIAKRVLSWVYRAEVDE